MTVEELLEDCDSAARYHNDPRVRRIIAALRERLLEEQKTRFFCTRCGYVGVTEKHDGCNYSALDLRHDPKTA